MPAQPAQPARPARRARSSRPDGGQVVEIGGRRLSLTNLDKVLYPSTGTTKAEVLAYLAAVAEPLVTHAYDRPATRKRWVHGTDGPVFFQKNLDDATPPWVPRRRLQHSDHVNTYPVVNDLATLTWLGQIAALEIHVPQWRFTDDADDAGRSAPDRLVLDLDPGPGAGLAECAEVARWARAILLDMNLEPFPVTSGSKGIHLYATLDGTTDAATVGAVAHELARALEADHPDLVVSDMKKSLREGKVLVDWSQNNPNKTTITPYSLRGRERPTVAAPRTWDELDSPDLDHLGMDVVVQRLTEHGDLLAGLLRPGETGPAPAPVGTDRLEVYRSKRDGSKTPEPVPARTGAPPRHRSADAPDALPTFVIQEHHARRLHFDFRLARDGVLVSWALPKGEPDDPGRNHLAVQTEDHPLEYGSFEGTIPKGEYGAGEVTIWDAGTYELHKWREGKEVIVTLHSAGRPVDRGTRKLALIHTGSGDGSSWLIHLMASDPPERSGDRPPARNERPAPRAPTQTREQAPAAAPGIAPMLATPGAIDDLDHTEDWAFEMKWDGVRAVVAVTDGRVTARSRNGIDLTATYPELAAVAGAVDGDVVLDGEIVALTRAGRPDFGRLQPRMNLTQERDVERAARAQPVDLMVFDLLERDGRRLTKHTYDDRRAQLAEVLTERGRVHLPPAFETTTGTDASGLAREAFEASRTLGLEGVVAKRRDSTYQPGRRARTWVKIKHERTQDVVVVGWRPGRDGRAGLVGSLLVAVPDDDGVLHYAGRVGSGFTEKLVRRLTDELARATRPEPAAEGVPRADAGDARWVEPERVGEVTFAEWTSTGRLRHPVWRGWRPDRSVTDVRRET